jgi:hypothetical protein
MSVSNYITNITADRNTIRNKLIELGLAQSGDKLTKLATAIDNIENQGSVNASVKEGESYQIKPGYHKGGTVTGTSGGGNYTLQTPEPVEPTKKQQTIAPTGDYYGLASVVVKAIPNQYQDVSSVDVLPEQVLANKIFVDMEGVPKTGTMPNNGAVNITLDTTTTSKTIDKGYHSGIGTAKIVLEEKTGIEPKKTAVTVTPTTGKVLSKVTVAPIPDKYQDVSGVTTTQPNVLDGTYFVDSTGALKEGTMPDKGAVNATIDGLTTTSYTIPAGKHNGSGKVSLTNDIENALAAI